MDNTKQVFKNREHVKERPFPGGFEIEMVLCIWSYEEAML